MSTQGPPPIRACRLWLRQSAAGKTYLAGFLGDLRVLVMARRDTLTDPASDHTHELLLAPAGRKPKAATATAELPFNTPAAENTETAPINSKTYRRARRPTGGPKNRKLADDPVPF